MIYIAIILLGIDIFYSHISLKIIALVFIFLQLLLDHFRFSDETFFTWLSIIFVGLGFYHPEYFFDSAFFCLGIQVFINMT